MKALLQSEKGRGLSLSVIGLGIKVVSVHGHGDYKREFVRLRALEDCELGGYMLVAHQPSATGKSSSQSRHAFCFPSLRLKKGDQVCVWTRFGMSSVHAVKGGMVNHLYWGLEAAIWGIPGELAMIVSLKGSRCFPTKRGRRLDQTTWVSM